MNAEPRRKRHRCPKWCHDCPDMREACLEGWAQGDESKLTDDDVMMPGCSGGAINGWANCHCSEGPGRGLRAAPAVRIEMTRREWNLLEERADAEGVEVQELATRLLRQVIAPPRRKPQLSEVAS